MPRTDTHRLPALRQLLFAVALSFCIPTYAQEDVVWNTPDPENTVYLELQEGTVVIELNPTFAPKTVKHLKQLMQDRFYRGQSFYRVIDGFVAQAGDETDLDGVNSVATIDAEFEIDWPLKPKDKEEAKDWQKMPWTLVQKEDLYAPYTGFINGFPAARDEKKAGKVWLTHCPGAIAMARNPEPNSSSTDFYIVIGQAPRYLDRNLTIFGRVIWGMDVVQRIKRGPTLKNGIIEDDDDRSWIKAMYLASSIEEEKRMDVWITDTNSSGFRKMMKKRRNRTDGFFHHKPPKVLDVCQVPVASRLEN
jgi:peptidylprolyl isomerase